MDDIVTKQSDSELYYILNNLDNYNYYKIQSLISENQKINHNNGTIYQNIGGKKRLTKKNKNKKKMNKKYSIKKN